MIVTAASALTSAASLELALEDLPAERQPAFRQLIDLLLQHLGSRVVSCGAYGGWLTGAAFHADSPANSVVVLSDVRLAELDSFAIAAARPLTRQKLAPPLCLTTQTLAQACDSYPLELLEIQQTGVPLYGPWPLATLTFAPRDVRLQCERELRGALLHLHQGVLSAAGKHTRLEAPASATVSRLERVLRGMLHLRGKQAARVEQLIDAVAAEFAVPLRTMAGIVAGGPVRTLVEFAELYNEVAALAAAVDGVSDAGA
jgi:hypothetical protein